MSDTVIVVVNSHECTALLRKLWAQVAACWGDAGAQGVSAVPTGGRYRFSFDNKSIFGHIRVRLYNPPKYKPHISYILCFGGVRRV